MTRHYKVTLASLALFFSAFASATAATTPPKVVFIGDWITYNWGNAFAANPNWINQGSPNYESGNSGETAARFQANVVSLHPAIVHIMVGIADEEEDVGDALSALTTPNFLANLNTMVQEAKAANIQVILGMEPSGVSPENAVIAAYGAANYIPVVSYEGVQMPTNVDLYSGEAYFPTASGYSQMTQIAENVISTMNLTLKGGYLQNRQLANGSGAAETNVNTVVPGLVIQFTPMGEYSDGSVHPVLNTNLQGASGSWTSSNPLVMYISPTGLANVLTPGTTIIRYTALNGMAFSEWIMCVVPGM